MAGDSKGRPFGKRILLAEDEAIVADTIRMAIRIDGHQVEHAENGKKALEMFEQGKHDLVITDFSMPEMDGLELAEAVKALSPATPVVLLTAFFELVRERGQVSHVDALLGKPCSIVELQATLRRLLGGHRHPCSHQPAESSDGQTEPDP